MRGPWRTRFGAVAAAVAVSLAGLLGGSAVRPAPVSAAYCDTYPELCTTYNVSIGGNGAGVVTTGDGSISCTRSGGVTSGTCSKRFIEDGNGNINFVLTVTASSGSYLCYYKTCKNSVYSFERTVGSSSGVVNDSDARFFLADCTAVDDSWCARLTIDTSGNGKGVVTTSYGPIECSYNGGVTSGLCEYDYWIGPEGGFTPDISVQGMAAAGSEVCEEDDCSASEGFNTAFGTDSYFEFSFNLLTYGVTVTRAGTGSGRVIGSAGGIDCGSTCTGTFYYGNQVTLAAVSNAGSTFQGWSGACAGQDSTCELTVTGAVSAAATFASSPGATQAPLPSIGTPSQPTATGAPGASAPPGASAGASAGTSAAPLPTVDASASIAPAVSASPGAPSFAAPNASADPGIPVTGPGGSDTPLLVVGMILAAIIVAIGLAVGLRGRRPPAVEPPAG